MVEWRYSGIVAFNLDPPYGVAARSCSQDPKPEAQGRTDALAAAGQEHLLRPVLYSRVFNKCIASERAIEPSRLSHMAANVWDRRGTPQIPGRVAIFSLSVPHVPQE